MRPVFFLFLFSFFIHSSCSFEGVLPAATGKPGELVVVTDTFFLNEPGGKRIIDSLSAAYPALPQYEPWFRVVTVPPLNFKSILTHHQNILMIETGPVGGGKDYALTMKRDVWAKPQLVLNLRARDRALLGKAVEVFAASIRGKFADEEISRLVQATLSANQGPVTSELQQILGVQMPFDEEYFLAKKSKGYAWIRKETIHTSIGFQIQEISYTSDSIFSAIQMVQLRDSVSKRNIPGPTPGSYMATETDVPVEYSVIPHDSMYVAEIAGLWRTEGDFMGGPFKSWLMVNRQSSRAFFVDAFVYAPKFGKREYMKRLDAMARCIRF
jgi:hypothetical protein